MPTAKPVALITGGAKGIGRAIARRLLASGWHVAIIDLANSGLRRVLARDRDILAIEGDVREEHTASDAVAATIHRLVVGQNPYRLTRNLNKCIGLRFGNLSRRFAR